MTQRINVTDLLPDTDYALRVRVRNGNATSDWSPIVPLTTITDDVLPSIPTGITWAASGDTFHGEWTPVTTNVNGDVVPITRYEIELVANSVTRILSVPQVIDTKVKFDLTFEQNRSLFGGQPTVVLRVRAVDNKELKSAWSSGVSASNAVPSNPTGFVATGGLGVIDLNWTAATDDDIIGYQLLIGASKIWQGDATRFTFQTPVYTSQTFTLKSVDKFQQTSTGVTASASATSPPGTDTTAPAQPTGISATITTANDAALTTYMDVSWTAVAASDLAGYRIRYRTGGSGAYQYDTVPPNTTSARIRGLEPYVNYQVSVEAFDYSANTSGFPADVTGTGATNTAPVQPQTPNAYTDTMRIQVAPTRNRASNGTAMDADVVYYVAYASTTNGFTTYDQTTRLGVIMDGPGASATFPIPASGSSTQTWYVKVIAVDKGGLQSSASPQATAAVGLIGNANIADATITDAKIANLSVTKLTAGTGLTTDFTVKSVLTMGDGSTSAFIRSHDYTSSGGTTGYEISKNSIIIKNGAIEAAALKIQNSPNIVPPEYASFESPTPAAFVAQGGVIVAHNSTARFGARSLATVWSTQVANTIVYLGGSTADYNIPFASGETYIISVYTWSGGAVATNVQLKVRWSNGTTSTIATTTNATGGTPATATRLQGTVTAPVDGGVIFIESSTLTNNAGYNLDGLQVEAKVSSLTTASTWKPPGLTRIDGGLIQTGAIRSTATAQVWDAANETYIPDPDGNPAWSINTQGAASFGYAQVRGSLVIGDQFTTGNDTTTTPDKQAFLASANYVPGSSGFILRGDGVAEFRAVAVGSFNGAAISDGTLAADTLSGGTVQYKLAIGAALETAQQQANMMFNTTNASTTVVANTGYFDAEDVGATITASNIPTDTKIVTVASDGLSATISNAATSTATDVEGIVYRGRRVRISGNEGVVLYTAAGSPIISLPTNPADDAEFAGKVSAKSLSVADNFRLSGTDNLVNQASSLTLAAGAYVPYTSPVVSFSWDSTRMTTSPGVFYNPTQDSIVKRATSFVYDAAAPGGPAYTMTHQWGGPRVMKIKSSPLGEKGITNLISPLNNSTANISIHEPYGGHTLMHSTGEYYFLLHKDMYDATMPMFVYKATRAAVHAGTNIAATGGQPWYPNDAGPVMFGGTPAIGARNGYLYTAWVPLTTSSWTPPPMAYKAGDLYLSKFTIGSTFLDIVHAKTFAGYIGQGTHIMSINAGQFDFGTGSIYVVVTGVLANGTTRNWVFRDTGTTFVAEGVYTFLVPDGKRPIGTTWVGTNNDDASGYFATLTSDGYIYKYTGLGRTHSTSTIQVHQHWRDGITAIGPQGPATVVAFTRRSKMTIKSREPLPTMASPGPSAVTFKVNTGAGSTMVPYYDPDNGTGQPVTGKNYITVSDFQTTAATIPTDPLPTGIAGSINSSAGLSISGDGHASFPGTGWQNLPLGSGWTAWNLSTVELPRYRRIGKTVQIRGLMQRTTGTGTTVFTLPDSTCFPSKTTVRVVSMHGSGAAGINISTSGVGTVAGYTANNNYIALQVEYDTDQP